MTHSFASPFDVMIQITGTTWAPGDGPNPTIGSWLTSVGSIFPETSAYCNSVMHADYFQWCGLTVAYCMASASIEPVFGADPVDKFLWAEAWLQFGDAVQAPAHGDVVVFNFGGGDHHVTMFESDLGNGYWACRGGNQSHEVKVSNYPKSTVMGIRRSQTIVPALVAVAASSAAMPQIDSAGVDDSTVPNKYPDLPVVPYQKTTLSPADIASGLVSQTSDVEIARAAYVLICNESASGRAGINNNYGGLQADAGRWSHEYDQYISGTCVLTDSGGSRRRFLCFRDASSCFKMITSVIQKRGLYVGGTTDFIISMDINTPADWAVAYYKEWVTGNADAVISPAQSRSLQTLYRSAVNLLPAVS